MNQPAPDVAATGQPSAGPAHEHAALLAREQDARLAAEALAAVAARLQRVTAALSAALTPAQVADVIVREAVPAFEAHAGSVWFLNEGAGRFELLGYVGYPRESEAAHARVPLAVPSPLRDAVGSRALIAVESPEALRARWPNLASNQEESGDAATIAAPMHIDSRVLGVLYLVFRTPRHFTPEDCELVGTLAQQCAQALDRAYLYESELLAWRAAEQARERLAFLAEAGALLSASLDKAVILQNLMQLVVPRFADWCVVYEQTPYGDFNCGAVAHRDPALALVLKEMRALPVPEDIAATLTEMVRSGTPVIVTLREMPHVPVASTDPTYRRKAEQLRGHSTMLVPLLAPGGTLGALSYVLAEPGRAYTAEDLDLARELARRAAIAIENAAFYATAREAIAVRDQFLIIASHELKTPLTALQANMQLVERWTGNSSRLTAKEHGTLSVALAQSRRLHRMIDAMLDVSRLQSGHLSLDRHILDLATLTRQTVGDIQTGLTGRLIRCALGQIPVLVVIVNRKPGHLILRNPATLVPHRL